VNPGALVTVTITAYGFGSFAEVVETLPDGFSFESSSGLPEDQVSEDGQEVTFSLLGAPATFTYTVLVTDEAESGSFSGEFSGVMPVTFDAFSGVEFDGDANITVEATAPSGPSVTRSLSVASVNAGDRVTVTITADGFGAFADVVETLPEGFNYSSSSLPSDEVSEAGQEVTFSLLGATAPATFTYVVLVTDEAESGSFSGEFSGVMPVTFDAFSGVEFDGDANITVEAEAAVTPTPTVSWKVPQTLSLNVMIRPISPMTDKDIDSYTIEKGRLPRNLRLDETTGNITGRPVRETALSTTVTIEACVTPENCDSFVVKFPPVRDRTVEEDAPTPTLPDVPPLDLSGVTVGDTAPSSGLQIALAATGGALLLGGIGVMTARRRIRARARVRR
jgi:hypothetical protein